MQSAEKTNQFNKVLEVLGQGSGVCDGNGTVIFGQGVGTCISVPDESEASEEGFVVRQEESKIFCLTKSGVQDYYWTFCFYSNLEETKKLLTVAKVFGDSFLNEIISKKSLFFRQLLLGGVSSVSPDEFVNFTGLLTNVSSDYTVVRVEVSQMIDDRMLEMLRDCLELVFPSKAGFCHTRIDTLVFAIVCPITEETNYKTLQSMSNELKDTVLVEVMVPVMVSIGGRVRTLKNIDMAYKSAERAMQVGNVFDFEDKCFSFDSLGVARLIYGIPKETCLTYLREIFGQNFVDEKTKKTKNSEFNDELIKTITKYLEMNQNISETARVLYIHRNTLIYRIEKFNKLTGLDCTTFEDGMKIKLGFMILKYVQKTNN